jgi:hypothetical protein
MKIANNQEKRPTIRISVELYDAIAESAKYHGRTFNAEVTARLQAAYVADQFERLSRENAEIKQLLKELIDKG